MSRDASIIALAIAAWLLLAFSIGLIAFTVGGHDPDTLTRWPTSVVFDWLETIAPIYRFLAAAVIGSAGGAMAVAAVRRYNELPG